MKPFNDYRMKFLLVGIVLCSTFALPILLVGQAQDTSNNHQESSEVVIMIAGYEYRYQPRPDLGHVVITQDNDNANASIQRNFSLFTQQEIKYIGGRDRQGLWVIESKQLDTQNKAVIKSLSTQKRIQYAAPLFSCNGETEAIIPEIVVRVTAGTEQEDLEQICQMMKLHIKRRMMFTEQEYLVDVLGENADVVFAALIELNQIESVEWAAPNVITPRKRPEAPISENDSQANVSLFNAPQTPPTTGLIPNDEYFPYQWHLHNTGQFGGTPDADINAPEAWEITAGDPNIVVAIVDTGVDSNHPDLVNNLVSGYDVYGNDDLPEPVVGNHRDAHGTACAGLVAAEGNNDIGVVGVAWKCKVMPIRDGTGSFVSVADGAEGYRWAAANGADILNYSTGFNNPKPILYSAIVDITKPGGIGRNGKGCVILASSYNDGASVRYPAAYPEVIAVGATDCNDAHWHYSNYGPELEIVTPSGAGREIADDPDRWSKEKTMLLSTDIVGQTGFSSHPSYKYSNELDYSFFSGTSASCPVAAGVAALILSIEPELTNEEVRHFLCRSATDLGEPGRDDYYGWGRIDARAALDMVLAARADLHKDGKVDLRDLLILIEFWGTNEPSADIAPATKRDGVVDEQDLELVMQYWLTEYPEFGLVAHWKMNETEGEIAYDSAGNFDGVLTGEPVWQPNGGMVDGALQLDGINDYVNTNPVLNPSDGSFSVFAWIKDGAPGQIIISQDDGTGSSVTWLGLDAVGGKLTTDLRPPGGRSPKPPLVSEFVVTDGDWHHVGFFWDGSYRSLYADGVEVAKDEAVQNPLKSATSSLYIGTNKTLDAGTFFSGLIDDVRIYRFYNVALSSE
jgi:subtilisin family serine protease